MRLNSLQPGSLRRFIATAAAAGSSPFLEELVREELARGACGNMPASGFADLYGATRQAWKAGKTDEAEDHFSKLLILIPDAQTYGVAGQKYILRPRGVTTTNPQAKMPAPHSLAWARYIGDTRPSLFTIGNQLQSFKGSFCSQQFVKPSPGRSAI